ncbi:MAG: putative glycolipid-binding domain-containing protein [Solirubrobacteraceae bacterium]
MARALAWIGDGAPRMEVAHDDGLTAVGTQLGAVYELRYRLEPHVLSLELVGERSLDVELGDADYFDLGWSPLFNSLPVVGDELLELGPPREYKMRWVDVPSLEIGISEQRYQPHGNGRVRFTTGGFTANIQFDDDGFVVHYPGIANRRLASNHD